MSFIQHVIQKVKPYMQSQGFSLKGRTFFKLQSDIAYCVTLEPGACVYVNVHINPLFMPMEFLHLTYGKRIVPNFFYVKKGDSEEWIEAWCQELAAELEKSVFPYFESISTAQKLRSFLLGSKQDIRNDLVATDEHLYKLMAYVGFYLQEEAMLSTAANWLRIRLSTSGAYSPEIREDILQQVQTLEQLAKEPLAVQQAFLQDIITKNTENFFTPRKRK